MVKSEIRWEKYGLNETIGMRTCLHVPADFAKTLKLRFCVSDLDLPERRGIAVAGRRGE